jgi:hypothetical protein
MQNKHQAGYYKANVNKDAFNYMRAVLNERSQESEDAPLQKNEILKKINDIDKSIKDDDANDEEKKKKES